MLDTTLADRTQAFLDDFGQLKAQQEGIDTPVYGLQKVHHLGR
ncbi:hypothetical protein [Ruegeria spongiae]|nr:hypothetical protein [Ruegeria spongiae]